MGLDGLGGVSLGGFVKNMKIFNKASHMKKIRNHQQKVNMIFLAAQ